MGIQVVKREKYVHANSITYLHARSVETSGEATVEVPASFRLVAEQVLLIFERFVLLCG